MRILRCLTISFFFLMLAGCALTAINEQNRQTETRVDAKMQELADQQNRQRVFIDEQRKLLQERDEKQRVLDDLNARLDNLIKKNAQAAVHNQAQQKKKEEIALRLREYREKIAKLNNGPGASDEEKKRQIEELEKQIDAYVKSLGAL